MQIFRNKRHCYELFLPVTIWSSDYLITALSDNINLIFFISDGNDTAIACFLNSGNDDNSRLGGENNGACGDSLLSEQPIILTN